MRSVVVVLPASMCAMMPMLRQRSRGKVRATAIAPTECGALRRQGLDEELPEKDRLPQREERAGFYTAGCSASRSSKQGRQQAPLESKEPDNCWSHDIDAIRTGDDPDAVA